MIAAKNLNKIPMELYVSLDKTSKRVRTETSTKAMETTPSVSG